MTTKTSIALGFVVCAGVGVGIALLLQNINQRQFEARQTHFKVVELDETTTDPAKWGANFPRQYDTYRRTVDMERTKFGGSEADPSAPANTTSKIEADPRLKTMWNGYAFAVDFREERGHAYMLQDQKDNRAPESRRPARRLPALPCLDHRGLPPGRHRGRCAGQSARNPCFPPMEWPSCNKGFEIALRHTLCRGRSQGQPSGRLHRLP